MTFRDVEVVPSPKTQNHDTRSSGPSGSDDWSMKVMSSSIVGFGEDTMSKSAVGGVFAMVTGLVVVSVDPSVSVTVSITLKTPSSGNL